MIGTATIEDTRRLREIDKLCFPDNAWTIADFKKEIKDDNKIVWCAWHPSLALFGYIAFDKRSGYIDSLAIHPNNQKSGWANDLLIVFERYLDAYEIPTARLHVAVDNVPALMLYLKRGYKIKGYSKKYYESGADALYMEKEI